MRQALLGDPAGMKTKSILDIKEHVGFFNGIAPVLALPFPLEAVALGMDANLCRGAPYSFTLFFSIRTTVFNFSDFDFVIETDFAISSGTTKTLGSRSFDGAAASSFHDMLSRLGKYFQPVKDPSANDAVLG